VDGKECSRPERDFALLQKDAIFEGINSFTHVKKTEIVYENKISHPFIYDRIPFLFITGKRSKNRPCIERRRGEGCGSYRRDQSAGGASCAH
jgi:hypothetical protein